MATVLYVDDEVAIRRAVATWLRRKGHVVHEADSSEAARAVLAEPGAALDGVFIDLWLGVESGVELFRWIEAQHPALVDRVVFVTGDLFDPPALARRAPVLRKPFELRDIEAQVLRWTEQQSS